MATGKLQGLLAFYRWMKSRDAGVSLRLLALGALLYVILPTDFIPDVVPFAGWLDDLGVVTFIATFLAKRFKKQARSTDAKDAPFSQDPRFHVPE
jgi:uncharacterized membrane protein YkvA (DUF1232 family)